MSNNVNDVLLEEAAFFTDYFVDKQPARLIEKALDEDDMDMLAQYVKAARDLMFEMEYSLDEGELVRALHNQQYENEGREVTDVA